MPDIVFLAEEESSFALPVLRSNRNLLYEIEQKPKFKRFHSSRRIENEAFIETKLIKNSHILISVSPKGSKTSRLEGNKQIIKDYTKDQFN